jgi:hypothetical protein
LRADYGELRICGIANGFDTCRAQLQIYERSMLTRKKAVPALVGASWIFISNRRDVGLSFLNFIRNAKPVIDENEVRFLSDARQQVFADLVVGRVGKVMVGGGS